MAMSVTKTTSKSTDPVYSGFQRIKVNWTSNDSGVASDTIRMGGAIYNAVVTPTGTTKPAALYDIALRDVSNSDVDYLDGALLNMLKSDVSVIGLQIDSANPPVVAGDVEFHVENASDARTGYVEFMLKN